MTRRVFSVAAGGGILAAGVVGMIGLASLRKPPAEAVAAPDRNRIRVEAMEAKPEDVTVTLTGYGEVKSIRTVEMAAEVSGTVVETHPRLVAGGVVRRGETLFELDPRPYQASVDQASARLAELDAQIRRLAAEQENDRVRLATLERSYELAQSQHQRTKRMYEDAIGDQLSVEEAERAMHTAEGAMRLLERQLTVYPLQVEELQQQRAAQKAACKQAELDLSYARVTAPFDGRLVEVQIERGQYITQGRTALRLADDSELEIPVMLDARDARAWLRFDAASNIEGLAWFSALDRVPCELRWAEDPQESRWEGTLDRVEGFDAGTRTLAVVVRVSADQARGPASPLPLVAGMFCEVHVPGRTLEGVFRMPQSAVTVDNTIYLAVNDRLTTVPVDVIRREDEYALVRGDVHPGDLLVTTRLVNVLDGTPLDVDTLPAPDSD